jgi:hypothetical protein
MAGDLRGAADWYNEGAAILGHLHRATGGCVAPGEYEKYRRLADPPVRRQIATAILQARDRDAEAADHIERALAG